MSLIGIAVTVWVGLNIYNIIQKSELEFTLTNLKLKIENLDEDYSRTKKDLEELKNAILTLPEATKVEVTNATVTI